jgi:hypothetical protein
MAQPLFHVNLSEDARDFLPTALEPGLPLLDRGNSTYAALRRWMGPRIAEPQWLADDVVAFYVREKERGRLERVEVVPASQKDLEGVLADDLKQLQVDLKKAKPESASEQALYKLIRARFNQLTADLAHHEVPANFFKYKAGSAPWKLVWCWGYQQRGEKPGDPVLCRNRECNSLFLKREGQKAVCPECNVQAGLRRRRVVPLYVPIGAIAALLLLIPLLLILLFPPTLVLNQEKIAGPPGSRHPYTVHYQRYFFFDDEVTSEVVPQSHDTRILQFDQGERLARAKATGDTLATFRYRNMVQDIPVQIGEPVQPDRLSVQPDKLKLAVGAADALKVIAEYKDMDDVDLTDIVNWEVDNSEIAYIQNGTVEALAAGKTKIKASYQAELFGSAVEGSAELTVTDDTYSSLALELDPKSLMVGQHGRLNVWGESGKGVRYPLHESRGLKLTADPADAFEVDGRYLIARKPGKAKVTADYGDVSAELEFDISSDSLLADGTLSVLPKDVKMVVGELVRLDVVSSSAEPITSESSNSAAVLTEGSTLVARDDDEAKVTVKQGDQEAVVNVAVSDELVIGIFFEPDFTLVGVGDTKELKVMGTTESGRVVELAPDFLTWEKRPNYEDVEFTHSFDSLSVTGKRPGKDGHILRVRNRAGQTAEAEIVVVGEPALDLALVDDFIAHPPIMGNRVVMNAGGLVGDGLVYRDGGLVVDSLPTGTALQYSSIPKGAIITGVNDFDLANLSVDEVRGYFRDRPLIEGDRLRYRLADGTIDSVALRSLTGVGAIDVRPLSVRPLELTATDFSAEVRVALREAGEYRLVDENDSALSDWKTLPAGADVTINSSKMNRNPEDEYKVFLERKIGDKVRSYPVQFRVEQQ